MSNDLHYHSDGLIHSTSENAPYCHECQAAALETSEGIAAEMDVDAEKVVITTGCFDHMTRKEVRDRVDDIRHLAGDPEHAHSEEDRLRYHVLKAIADGAQDAPALAREALRTDEIRFPRWCA